MAIRGRMNRDINGVQIQRARAFQTTDAGGQQSPVNVSTNEVVVEAPVYALGVFIYSDQDIYLDSKTGVSSSQGFLLMADAYMQMDLDAGNKLYLVRGGSSNAKVSLIWQTIPE
jgi:hypothetical protein